jgi:hypothetical protein
LLLEPAQVFLRLSSVCFEVESRIGVKDAHGVSPGGARGPVLQIPLALALVERRSEGTPFLVEPWLRRALAQVGHELVGLDFPECLPRWGGRQVIRLSHAEHLDAALTNSPRCGQPSIRATPVPAEPEGCRDHWDRNWDLSSGAAV